MGKGNSTLFLSTSLIIFLPFAPPMNCLTSCLPNCLKVNSFNLDSVQDKEREKDSIAKRTKVAKSLNSSAENLLIGLSNRFIVKVQKVSFGMINFFIYLYFCLIASVEIYT